MLMRIWVRWKMHLQSNSKLSTTTVPSIARKNHFVTLYREILGTRSTWIVEHTITKYLFASVLCCFFNKEDKACILYILFYIRPEFMSQWILNLLFQGLRIQLGIYCVNVLLFTCIIAWKLPCFYHDPFFYKFDFISLCLLRNSIKLSK